MRLAAMQPYFFPYLGYFQLIAAADRFLLYDNLNYMRQGWVHRNRIRLSLADNGKRLIEHTAHGTQTRYRCH